MHAALRTKNNDLVKIIIEKGADIHTSSDDVRKKSIDGIFGLIYIMLCSQQGDTPLLMATKKEMMDTVKLLIDRGADIDRKDKVSF